MARTIILAVIALTCIAHAQTSRILVFIPTASTSHSLYFRPIIRELSLRGHEVVSITTDPMNDPKLVNLTEIDLHDLSYGIWFNLSRSSSNKLDNDSKFYEIMDLCYSLKEMNDAQLGHPEVQALVRNNTKRFDLVINEWIFYPSTFIFGYIFDAPVVGMSSMPAFLHGLQNVGMPVHPAYVLDPNQVSGRGFSFWTRLDNAILYMWRTFFYHEYIFYPMHDAIARKHFGDFNLPYLGDIVKNVSLLITNSNPIFHLSRPVVPNVIEIGGIHKRERKPLPSGLKTLLDNATEGVIYFSFGTNVKSSALPPSVINIFMQAFAELPYKVLWKFEKDELPVHKPDNVIIRKWLPQQDVLDHENVKIFIMQGGLQSIEESIRSKKPMIGIPFFADQDYNCARFPELEIGEQLSLPEMTKEILKSTIVQVITDAKYQKGMEKVAGLLWDQQTDPLERAMWWIEYVIRHKGAPMLRTPLADMPWYKFLMLDIFGFLLACFVAFLFVAYVMVKYTFRYSKVIINAVNRNVSIDKKVK